MGQLSTLERPIEIAEDYTKIVSVTVYVRKGAMADIPNDPESPLKDPDNYWGATDALQSEATDPKWLKKHRHNTMEDSIRTAAKGLCALIAVVYGYEKHDGSHGNCVRYFYPKEK